MGVIAIVGDGPQDDLPHLKQYEAEVDIWIGADRGALAIINEGLVLHEAIGDFDSVTNEEREVIFSKALHKQTYAAAKDATDLELALEQAFFLQAKTIYLFGVTGGRFDHTFINVQFLYNILKQDCRGIIVDRYNEIELLEAGVHTVYRKKRYQYVSFVPFTEKVTNISLSGFRYPLENYDEIWGTTRLISNEFVEDKGKLSFSNGLLLMVQSRDKV